MKVVLFEFDGRVPEVGQNTYVATSAEVIGEVKIGDNCYIGPGAKIRGDYGTIIIGNASSVQENCVIHARPNEEAKIGNNVTMGHGAILHGGDIKDNVVLGMGSIVSDHAIVHSWSIIAESALVRSGQVIEEGSIAVGIPAKVKMQTNDDQKEFISWSASTYVEMARKYQTELKKIK